MTQRRVLVIHPSDEMYGADRVLLEVLDSRPEDVEVSVWLPTDLDYPQRPLTNALESRGIPVRRLALPIARRAYRTPSGLLRLGLAFLRSAAAVIRMRPDAVYVNTSAGALMLPLAKLVGASTVLHLHEYLDAQARPIGAMLRWADRIIAVSNAILEPLPEAIRAKAVVIYNGFELPSARDVPQSDVVVFVIASRWNAWKGHASLFEAWERVTRTDARLVVLGAVPPSGDGVDVVALRASLSHPESVTIVGEHADVRPFIDAAHVVVVPSTRPDPLPTIAIEALAAGRLVIGSRTGGLPEIVGDTGVLVEPADPDALAAAIDAVTLDDVLRAHHEGPARSAELFSPDRFRVDVTEAVWR